MQSITCFIEYEISPYQLEDFRQYARAWGRIIPFCGGNLMGYFLPHEGTNNKAFGLIMFESLSAYEAYRARLKKDPDAQANFAFAQDKRFIRSEKRTFLRNVTETMGRFSNMLEKEPVR